KPEPTNCGFSFRSKLSESKSILISGAWGPVCPVSEATVCGMELLSVESAISRFFVEGDIGIARPVIAARPPPGRRVTGRPARLTMLAGRPVTRRPGGGRAAITGRAGRRVTGRPARLTMLAGRAIKVLLRHGEEGHPGASRIHRHGVY